jgi:hypothetical protein
MKTKSGLLYHERILYVLNKLVWLQNFQGKHDTLTIGQLI